MAVSVITDTLLYNTGSQFIKINLENYNRQEVLAVWYNYNNISVSLLRI